MLSGTPSYGELATVIRIQIHTLLYVSMNGVLRFFCLFVSCSGDQRGPCIYYTNALLLNYVYDLICNFKRAPCIFYIGLFVKEKQNIFKLKNQQTAGISLTLGRILNLLSLCRVALASFCVRAFDLSVCSLLCYPWLLSLGSLFYSERRWVSGRGKGTGGSRGRGN